MTAQILPFKRPRPSARAKKPAMPVLEGVIVSEVPPDALPTGCDLALPVANRMAHVPWKAPRKPPRKPRAKMRVEQIEVTCVRVPRKQHNDLRMPGVLTIDWKGDVAWTMTFDGDDESIPNIVAPIESFARTADGIKVTSDEGVWTFAPIESDDDGDEE